MMRTYHSSVSSVFFLFLVLVFLAATSSSQENPTDDTANARAAHWSLDPKYETVKSRVSYVPGIKVIRGRTQVIVPFYHDLYPPDCGNYFSMAEVAPDVLLVVYARTNLNDHWQSEFVGTYFHVEREDR